jgi:hypothetical protein
LPNGWHSIKLVTYDRAGNAKLYRPLNLYFNNAIYSFDFNDSFHPSQNYPISGFTDFNSVEIRITSENDDILWSQNFAGPGYIEANIPGSTFTNQGICNIIVIHQQNIRFAGLNADIKAEGASSAADSVDSISKSFRPEDYPTDANIQMAIILPDPEVRSSRLNAIQSCVEACQRRSIGVVILYNHDVVEENLRYVLMRMGKINYIYWAGHANAFADARNTIQRTNLVPFLKNNINIFSI